ncbi:PIN domain-containing protein [Hamadaea sp. NPDC050747]|uniref:PIN domain-containing protein n=1 Tax=Hamadaea sp. NPDC050747 TaxID=3155789 RepID=UPI0033F9FF5E
MFIDMVPGANRANLLQTLNAISSDAQNLRNRGTSDGSGPSQRVAEYVAWANRAVSMLTYQVSPRDIDRLILTRRYELLLGAGELHSKAILNLLYAELDSRVRILDDLISDLQRQTERWPDDGERFVAMDTGVFLHGDKIEELDLQQILHGTLEPIRLLIPMVVIDELDRLKEKNDVHIRWRAGYTLAVLDRIVADPRRPARLFAAGFSGEGDNRIPRGEVTVEIILDRPGHVRLPSDDDELIDRLASIQPLAQRQVTLITYDTGMRHRAISKDLKVIKLDVDLGPEPPPPGQSTRAKRRERMAMQNQVRQQHAIEHGDTSAVTQ